MKKSHIPYIVFVILILILLFISNYRTNILQQNTTNYEVDKNEFKTKNELPEKDKLFYLVKEKNNEIFLYDGNMKVIEKLDINFNDLREYDKKMFVFGIKFENIDDVYSLLEDFSN